MSFIESTEKTPELPLAHVETHTLGGARTKSFSALYKNEENNASAITMLSTRGRMTERIRRGGALVIVRTLARFLQLKSARPRSSHLFLINATSNFSRPKFQPSRPLPTFRHSCLLRARNLPTYLSKFLLSYPPQEETFHKLRLVADRDHLQLPQAITPISTIIMAGDKTEKSTATEGSITTKDGVVMSKSDIEFLMACIQNTTGGQLLVSKHPSNISQS